MGSRIGFVASILAIALLGGMGFALIDPDNRAVSTAQVIEELIAVSKEFKVAKQRGELLGLSEDEKAFYAALRANDSAVLVLGDDTLNAIARELVEKVRVDATIDWTLRQGRPRLGVYVRQVLPKYEYRRTKDHARAGRAVCRRAGGVDCRSAWRLTPAPVTPAASP
jgi:hypothetical protein